MICGKPRYVTVTELRRHARFPFSGPLQVRALGSLDWIPVEALDVSASGLSFRAPLPFEIDDAVRIVGPDEAFLLDVRVRHVKKAELGFVVGVERHPAG